MQKKADKKIAELKSSFSPKLLKKGVKHLFQKNFGHMKILLNIFGGVIAVISIVMVVRFSQVAKTAQQALDEERYLKLTAEEQLENVKNKVGSLESDLTRAQSKVSSLEKVLDETKSYNSDLKTRLDKASEIKTDLEQKLEELEQVSSTPTPLPTEVLAPEPAVESIVEVAPTNGT
jgi:predicted RNase H-like nuclease (RuvC/YqgF family)